MSLFEITRRRVVAFLLGIVLPASVYAANQAEIGPFEQHLNIETTGLSRRDLSQVVTSSGKITAHTQLDLKFQTSGQLAWINVEEGEYVTKGQAIAGLDQQELRKKLQKDLNSFVREYTEFDDTQGDYKDTPLSSDIKRILQRAQIDLDQEVLDVEVQNLAIRYATIYAPIDGLVTNIDVPVPGINITPATATFTIVDPASLYFKAEVDETEIRLIKPGQHVELQLDALPDETLDGRVTDIAFSAETARGGGNIFPVDIYMPNKNNFVYRIGMNGDADFRISTVVDALALPIEALLPDDNVWIQRGDRFEKVSIETGIESDDYVEVLSGLEEDDRIVIGGFENLPS